MNPTTSPCITATLTKVSLELGRKLLKLNNPFPYKMYIFQELDDDGLDRRFQFYERFKQDPEPSFCLLMFTHCFETDTLRDKIVDIEIIKMIIVMILYEMTYPLSSKNICLGWNSG